MSEKHETVVPTEPHSEPVDTVTTEAQEAPKPRRRAARSSQRVTIRNRTRKMVMAMDANGDGLYLFPSVETEIAADLVGSDIHDKARIGLLALD